MPPTCSICRHEDRDAIDAALMRGESLRDIATRFETTPSSLQRHKDSGHIQEKVQQAVAERELLSARRLVEISQDGLIYLIEAIQACRETGDHRTLIAALRELREYIPFTERMLGISGGSTDYQNDPEWQSVRLLLVEIAREYPQIRPRVLEIVGDVDGVEA